jgi:outer membrane receptor protein involved in Fe transport
MISFRLTSISFLVLFFAVITNVHAQQTGNKNANGNPASKEGFGVITGSLRDSATNQAVEFGSIVLYRVSDNSMVTGTTTDSKGKFLLEKLVPGKYFMRIQFIGYESKKIPDVNVSVKNADIKLGTIFIKPTSSSLSGVVITSQKALITNNLDKKVISVDKNMSIGGGTATDVMENVPSVAVDAEGNVSLRGNSNITLLIDGKPSTQTGLSASDILNQIPASAIESVEVITNPSVRYDPDGTTGIINLVLKKKALQGFNGMVSGNIGTGQKYNGSANLNYRRDKFNVFVGADLRMNHTITSMENIQTSIFNDTASTLKQWQDGYQDRNMLSFSGGVDYFINTRNNLTVSVQNRNMAFNSDGLTKNHEYDFANSLTRYYERQNYNHRKVDAFDYTLSYKHLFQQKGREFTNDIIFSDNTMENGSDIITQYFISEGSEIIGLPNQQKNTARNENKALTIQGNYIYPKDAEGRVEAGYKVALRDMAMRYDYSNYDYATNQFISQENLANHYDYTDQLYAIYGLYGGALDKLKYQAGLRFEQVYTISKVALTDSNYNSSYSSFYPSLHFQYEIGKQREMQFSYSRRVMRPSPREMNPYIDFSDSSRIETGNPALKPEFSTSLEMGIEQYWKSSSVSASVFYNHTKDVVEDISRVIGDGITLTMPMNINTKNSYGLEAIGTLSPAKWVKLNANFSVFRDVLGAIPAQNIEGTDMWSWSSRLNMSFVPWKDASLQLIGNYNSPTQSVQEYHKEQYYADASFRQDFYKNKLSLTLRLTDIFNTRTFYETTTGNDFTSESKRYRESRVLYAGLLLKINNYNKKAVKETGSDSGEQEGF